MHVTSFRLFTELNYRIAETCGNVNCYQCPDKLKGLSEIDLTLRLVAQLIAWQTAVMIDISVWG